MNNDDKIKDIVRTQLLSGIKGLRDPFWRNMDTQDRLLHACLCAYAKHTMGHDIIGWNQLGDILHNAICEAVGDNNFCSWGDRLNEQIETTKE